MNRGLTRNMFKDSACRMAAQQKQEQRQADHLLLGLRALKQASRQKQEQPVLEGEKQRWLEQLASWGRLVSAARVFPA